MAWIRQIPSKSFIVTRMCLVNIRAWNVHLEHFLSDKVYQSYPRLLYFSETNINHRPLKYIDNVLNDWRDIHKNTQHDLVLCYKVNKVNIIGVIDIPSAIEVLLIVPEIGEDTFLLVILYWAPSLVGSFIDDFILLVNELPTQHRILIVGNFNIDQMFFCFVF